MSHSFYCPECGSLVGNCGMSDDHTPNFYFRGSCGRTHPVIYIEGSCGPGARTFVIRNEPSEEKPTAN